LELFVVNVSVSVELPDDGSCHVVDELEKSKSFDFFSSSSFFTYYCRYFVEVN